ncbi:MAG: DUF3043 domain-containing protein [Micrococcales bacterium]|nr:DUF3043 domain-containing protein [Micrococcales bacterium]
MFGRKKKDDAAAAAAAGGKKGRPTPTRREAEAVNKRPLVPGRGEIVAANRDHKTRARELQQRALQTGDEKYLPKRDKGPARRFARDWVDSHRSLGEYFLIFAIGSIMLVFSFQQVPAAAVVTLMLMYLFTVVFIADAVVRGLWLKRKLRQRFEEEDLPRWTTLYGVLRSLQLRRTRLPKPQVARGEHPK